MARSSEFGDARALETRAHSLPHSFSSTYSATCIFIEVRTYCSLSVFLNTILFLTISVAQTPHKPRRFPVFSQHLFMHFVPILSNLKGWLTITWTQVVTNSCASAKHWAPGSSSPGIGACGSDVISLEPWAQLASKWRCRRICQSTFNN